MTRLEMILFVYCHFLDHKIAPIQNHSEETFTLTMCFGKKIYKIVEISTKPYWARLVWATWHDYNWSYLCVVTFLITKSHQFISILKQHLHWRCVLPKNMKNSRDFYQTLLGSASLGDMTRLELILFVCCHFLDHKIASIQNHSEQAFTLTMCFAKI